MGVRVLESQPVELKDPTRLALILPLCQDIANSYTLGEIPTPGSYTITLADATGIVIGDGIKVVETGIHPSVFFYRVLNVAGNVITLDTPIPEAYRVKDVSISKINPNAIVNGSVTPAEFRFANDFDYSIDITRLIFHITDNAAMDDALFGGIPALTRGVAVRRKNADGSYTNYFNIKANGQFGEIAFDKVYDSKAPAGVYGFTARLTFSGQEKMGVVLRLAPGEEIQLLVQDDLTTLTSFLTIAEGHVTDEVSR